MLSQVNGPARPKTASGFTSRAFSHAWPGILECLFLGKSSLASCKEAPAASEVRRHVHFPNPVPEPRLLLRGSTELLAPPWMLWRAFLGRRPASALLQASVLEPAEDRDGPCPAHGICHSDFGIGVPYVRGFCKAACAEAYYAPLSV